MQIIGHRGAAGLAPENTLESFFMAYDHGCRFVEFDVMLTQDRAPIVFHDANLKRTTDGSGFVSQSSLSKLKTLDAGSWFSKRYHGVRIATLEETLNFLVEKNMQANIEIKTYLDDVQPLVTAVMSCLSECWPKNISQPLVSSFDTRALYAVRSKSNSLPLGFLMDIWSEDGFAKAKDLNCVSVNLNFRELNQARVDALKEQGFLVYVYTVNCLHWLNRCLKLGVDGVFSDYPCWSYA